MRRQVYSSITLNHACKKVSKSERRLALHACQPQLGLIDVEKLIQCTSVCITIIHLSLVAHPQVLVVRQVDPHLPVAVVQEFEAQMVLVIPV